SYAASAGRENMPVNNVSFYDALRFANWMNNGQGNGDTQTGSYTLLGPYTNLPAFDGGYPSNGDTVTRNLGASIVLTSEDEWYKAAYYDPTSASYFDYPAGSSTIPTCTAPTAALNSANCDGVGTNASDPDVDDFTIVGSFSGSAGPYDTFDQGGNVWEWNESITHAGADRSIRGGSFGADGFFLDGRNRLTHSPQGGFTDGGFRLAMIPGGYV